jgi:hypothetical protein
MLSLVDNESCGMNYLTTKQIEDFNNPLAFARTRTTSAARSLLGQRENAPIRTGNMEESYRLIVGAAERLEILRGNLSTMLDLAQQGARVRGNTRKASEFYGKIRSLTAGLDQVVEAIQFKKQPIFTDRKIQLEMDSAGRNINLDPIRLLTYGENSLNLSQSIPSADVSIQYLVDDKILNDGYDIVGLDLTGGSYYDGGESALELESGVYKVNIEYAGKNSAVSIRTREGELISRQENVDLSGSGSQWVDFDQGVRLKFEMKSLFSSFDKYDFEANGPANLSATMNYKRIDRQLISTADGPPQRANAQLLTDIPLRLGESSIKISNTRVAPIAPEAAALKSGTYNIQIDYFGENSVVRLTDSFGRIQSYKFGIDLSQQGNQRIDFGNGLSFDFENDNFSTNGTRYSAVVKYVAETKGIDSFDFRAFQSKIRDAIKIIEEQQEIIAKTQAQIEDVNRLRNQARVSAAPNAVALNTGSALNLISGGGGIGIFGSVSPDARFGILSEQLFQTTTALPTQANQTPQALAQISKSGSVGSLLATFT